MIPLAAFPLLGVLNAREAAASYGDDLVLLFLGGFILSTALEKSGAHRRIALGMIRLFGTHGGGWRVVFGFMTATAFLSMWMSNAATTMMMLPVALAVVGQTRDKAKLAPPLLIGIAYASSIGGLGTPIGTPPNGVFMAQYAKFTGQTWGFTDWMRIGMPIMLVMLPLTGLWLTRSLRGKIHIELPGVGAWHVEEIRVLALFALTSAAWIFRASPGGGWAGVVEAWTGAPGSISDSTIALAMAVVMFLVPNGRGGTLLDWHTAERIPWGILILYGGGIAISAAFQKTGLADAVGDAMRHLKDLHPMMVIGAVTLLAVFMSEFASNTALATLLMPVMYAAAAAAQIEPAKMMIPAALGASAAFMMPVGTPPNAMVFATGLFPMSRMIREGLVINVIGVGVITLMCYVLL
jgi:sodium-dependent dicarboxylate transporter 2/3/5